MNPLNNRKFVWSASIFMAALIVATTIHYVVLGGVSPTNLPPATALAGTVAQGLVSSQDPSYVPVYDVDFRLNDTVYFENKAWVVSTIVPLKGQSDLTTVVLKKVDGQYEIVLGPGTVFPVLAARSLPLSVSRHLAEKMMFHG